MLTDCKLFKVKWVKQFNFRDEEPNLMFQIMKLCLREQPVQSIDVAFNHKTSFRAFPFYDVRSTPGKLYGLVYEHSATQGRCEEVFGQKNANHCRVCMMHMSCINRCHCFFLQTCELCALLHVELFFHTRELFCCANIIAF